MTPKEIADKMQCLGFAALTPAELCELRTFLRNLPTIPPTHRWDGELRSAKYGEDYLFNGKAVRCQCAQTPFAYPILRKIEPEFKPGEIVVNGNGVCRYIGSDGVRLWWDGSPCKGVAGPWRVATDEELSSFIEKWPDSIKRYVMNGLREKYGGGDE